MAGLNKFPRAQHTDLPTAPPEVYLTRPGFRSGGFAGSIPLTTQPPPRRVSQQPPSPRSSRKNSVHAKIFSLILTGIIIGPLIYYFASGANSCKFGYSPDANYCNGNKTEVQCPGGLTMHQSPFAESKKDYTAWLPEDDFTTIYACSWRSEREVFGSPWLCQKASCKGDWVAGDKCNGFKHACENGGQSGGGSAEVFPYISGSGSISLGEERR